jgi:hypothetical protein
MLPDPRARLWDVRQPADNIVAHNNRVSVAFADQAIVPAYIKTDSNEHRKHFPESTREGITGAIRRRFRGWHRMASAVKSES